MTDSGIAIELNRQISATNAQWHSAPLFTERPELKRRIASMLAYSIGHLEPAFVHALITDAESRVRVTVFTDKTVVIVDAAEEVIATVVPRSALEAVRITQVPDLIGDSWPEGDALRFVLSYRRTFGEDLTLELGHDLQTARNTEELTAFLPELHGDLLR